MPVKGADADAGLPGDGLKARLRATDTENGFGSLKYSLAVPNRIGARLSYRLRPCRLLHAIVHFGPLKSGGTLRIWQRATPIHSTSSQANAGQSSSLSVSSGREFPVS